MYPVMESVDLGLCFADAKRRRLQGKDRQPCLLLGVIQRAQMQHHLRPESGFGSDGCR